MRRYAIILAVLTLGLARPQHQTRVGTQFDAKVIRIADGDTLELIPVGEQRAMRIRLEGVDAPELGEAFSRDAQSFVRALLFEQRVRVYGRDVDRYGRLVARVVVGSKDASTELLRAGLACHRFASDALLASTESRARAAGVGFWAATAKKPQCVERTARATPPRPKPPGATPREAAPRTEAPRANATVTQYHGNVSSRLYHAPSCPNYNCRNCTRVFASEAAAKAEGFAPASDCLRRQE